MQIHVIKDGDGFTAVVIEAPHIFAHGETPEEARQELLHVVEMMMEIHREELKNEQTVKEKLLTGDLAYAI